MAGATSPPATMPSSQTLRRAGNPRMRPAFVEEFKSVDAVLDSGVRTAGVDAFALSLLKAERQARRFVTYLVFQCPCLSWFDIAAMRGTLAASKKVYCEGFLRGFDALYPTPLETLVGTEYAYLRGRLNQAEGHRSKLFHGQLTEESLSRTHLLGFVADMRRWSDSSATQGSSPFNIICKLASAGPLSSEGVGTKFGSFVHSESGQLGDVPIVKELHLTFKQSVRTTARI